MTEKLARRGLHVPGEYEANVLHMVRVSEVMRTDVRPISAEMTVSRPRRTHGSRRAGLQFIQLACRSQGKTAAWSAWSLRATLLRALENDPEGRATVLEAGSDSPIVAYADEFVHDAIHRMVRHNIGRLPVVSRENPRQMTGYFDRSNILGAWTRQMEDEGVQEHGWLKQWSTANSAARVVRSSTLEEVSKATGASERGLAAIMNLLVAIDFLATGSDGRYSLTPESSAFLVSNKPGFHGGFVHQIVSALMSDFSQLTDIVRSGVPIANRVDTGAAGDFFEQLVGNIMPIAFPGARVLAETLGVSKAVQPVPVLDLGAGSGVWGIALAQASPQVRVTAVDMPVVLEVTRKFAHQLDADPPPPPPPNPPPDPPPPPNPDPPALRGDDVMMFPACADITLRSFTSRYAWKPVP